MSIDAQSLGAALALIRKVDEHLQDSVGLWINPDGRVTVFDYELDGHERAIMSCLPGFRFAVRKLASEMPRREKPNRAQSGRLCTPGGVCAA